MEPDDELTYQQQLIAAVWMVGNMDTAEDKAAWWRSFGELWQHIADTEPDAQHYADAMFSLRSEA